MYHVFFYKDMQGNCPADDCLNNLPMKLRAKAAKWIEKLEQEGPDLPRPFADTLRGKIRELRVRFGRLSIRFLYFFFGKKIIITHRFMKKTRRVPAAEIDRSERMMKEFLKRNKREGRSASQ
jgi:phage-related protein